MKIEEADPGIGFELEESGTTYMQPVQRYDDQDLSKTYVNCSHSPSKVILRDMLGGTGQVKMHKAEFLGNNQQYVAKVWEVLSEETLTNQALEEAYDEFTLF